jgi:hypothetical protein
MSQIRLTHCLLIALVLYISSYAYLSRQGYRSSREVGFAGFYFVLPESEFDDHVNTALLIAYYPLIRLEMLLGTGMHPGAPPLRLKDNIDK